MIWRLKAILGLVGLGLAAAIPAVGQGGNASAIEAVGYQFVLDTNPQKPVKLGCGRIDPDAEAVRRSRLLYCLIITDDSTAPAIVLLVSREFHEEYSINRSELNEDLLKKTGGHRKLQASDAAKLLTGLSSIRSFTPLRCREIIDTCTLRLFVDLLRQQESIQIGQDASGSEHVIWRSSLLSTQHSRCLYGFPLQCATPVASPWPRQVLTAAGPGPASPIGFLGPIADWFAVAELNDDICPDCRHGTLEPYIAQAFDFRDHAQLTPQPPPLPTPSPTVADNGEVVLTIKVTPTLKTASTMVVMLVIAGIFFAAYFGARHGASAALRKRYPSRKRVPKADKAGNKPAPLQEPASQVPALAEVKSPPAVPPVDNSTKETLDQGNPPPENTSEAESAEQSEGLQSVTSPADNPDTASSDSESDGVDATDEAAEGEPPKQSSAVGGEPHNPPTSIAPDVDHPTFIANVSQAGLQDRGKSRETDDANANNDSRDENKFHVEKWASCIRDHTESALVTLNNIINDRNIDSFTKIYFEKIKSNIRFFSLSIPKKDQKKLHTDAYNDYYGVLRNGFETGIMNELFCSELNIASYFLDTDSIPYLLGQRLKKIGDANREFLRSGRLIISTPKLLQVAPQSPDIELQSGIHLNVRRIPEIRQKVELHKQEWESDPDESRVALICERIGYTYGEQRVPSLIKTYNRAEWDF